MRNDPNLIPAQLSAAMVRSYIDFDGHASTVKGQPSLQAKLQSEGVAALWHLLETKGFAYLADEVGMGKTRESMGIIATQFLRKPDSRVVIVCSSDDLQVQWQSEWSAFLQSCFGLLDDRLLGSADANQLEQLHLHENLREFVTALRRDESRIHLLRYSSFSWPLSLGDGDLDAMMTQYAKSVGVAHPAELSEREREIAGRFAQTTELAQTWRQELTHALAATYCERLGALLTYGTKHDGQHVEPLDLVIFDEAQYLRHTNNFRNQCIADIFRGRARRWLFVSATPLHSGEHDIRSLDNYLCRKLPVADAPGGASGIPYPRSCEACEYARNCSHVAWQLDRGGDVVEILEQFMVRRTRTYADGDAKRYGKIAYRHYERVHYSGADDPFYALTMALAQKRLVDALAGKNNKFRQGECASFESLSSSVGRFVNRNRTTPAVPARDYEPQADGKNADEPGVAVDRTEIDELNHSFVRAMSGAKEAHGLALPHAKLNETVDALFERSLKDGSVNKTLVFVRRIDTVEEIRDLLHARFQQEIDARIGAWHTLLHRSRFQALRSSSWGRDSFWTSRAGDAESPQAEGEENDIGSPGEPVRASGFHTAASLKYFEALQRASGRNAASGKLVSFAGRLLSAKDPSNNPLRGFLLKRPDSDDAAPTPAIERIWQANEKRWERFLEAVLGAQRVSELRDDAAHAWLFHHTKHDSDDAWKLGALQRCLLESMRHSDFIVDLYILNGHLQHTPKPQQERDLPEKLIWLLNNAGTLGVPRLATYIANWKERFRRWIEHFDLIVNKCLRGGAAASWKDICNDRVKAAFLAMSPVVGRSGRLENKYAVAQFNFPVHPNVLVCTDVLKEGVDMHLFCDEIMHYGVAWTSGDLEQRIGRIDRLGSLIGRRIARHSQLDAGAAPRLEVKFPYLDGTLDRYQVDRVIRDKIVSDLRMDLGKRKDEIGELDIGTLDIHASMHVIPDSRTTRSHHAAFFPEDAEFVRDDQANAPIVFPQAIQLKRPGQHVQPWQPDDGPHGSQVHLPAFACTRVLRRVDDDFNVLRFSRAPGKRADMLLTEEVLVPAGGDASALAAQALRDAGPTGVREFRDDRFSHADATNTVVYHANLSFAFGDVTQRASQVHLESIAGEFWLLRSAVCASEAVQEIAEQKDIRRWMATHNRERRWGYLMNDAGLIWFCVVVREAGDAARRLLARLAEPVARAACFYRSTVANTSEYDAPAWRSPSAFPSAGLSGALSQTRGGDGAARISKTITSNGIPEMKHEDLLVCGQVLSGVRTWFSEAFEAVLKALYADERDPSNQRLTVEPIEFLDGGLLRLRTEGAEHFCIQAYLDLGGVLDGGGIFAGPKMLWELGASPISRGKRPTLELSALEALPHVSTEGWEGEVSERCGVFTCKGEKYRFLSVYHTPQAWDSARDGLLAAWRDVRAKMQAPTSFQKKSCRDAFLDELGEARAEA